MCGLMDIFGKKWTSQFVTAGQQPQAIPNGLKQAVLTGCR